MILDLVFVRERIRLVETNLIVPDDQAAALMLASGRDHLDISVWQDQRGVSITAGPFPNRSTVTRWRGHNLTPNRWHRAVLESNPTHSAWTCRYRIYSERRQTRK